ncbi:hypothetical protein GE21DRAFT_8092 [Neurospora crassa]|uniref:Questionable protein n=2 Tax=Neurospora crassa TaxID=5141 RepID=Q1K6V3_NEUCR|nr:questionable protein [Neurospora crassa OR74A]EAA31629.1 questionable protein [Neurospora crassa OR74A]KHE87420.1 hypothetical protein GE21DRAFT_8092 [Neurospora crassa]CAD71017.1 questionable protein [Neurospora crassa]|eukprot:XP_960865.1 questionable protein [Neurospora crassa OR74A]
MSYLGQTDDRAIRQLACKCSVPREQTVHVAKGGPEDCRGAGGSAVGSSRMGPRWVLRMVTRHFILVQRSRSPVSLLPRRRFGRPTPPHPAPSPTLLASKQHIIISDRQKRPHRCALPKNFSPSKISSLRQAENPKMVP